MIGNKACGPCGTGPRAFPPLWWGFTDFPPVAPFYWDVYSAEERVKALCDYLWKTIHFAEGTAQDVDEIEKQLSDLLAEFEDFKEHGFDDYYRDQVAQWIAQNSKYLFDTLARQVYFGINREGYFVAFIPESWDDIIFDTGRDYSKETYGRLILRWETDPREPWTYYQEPEDARR